MTNAFWIARRELSSFMRTPMGYIIISCGLLLDGLFWNAFFAGRQEKSAQVLENFFFSTSGVVAVASIFVAMKLIAEERQSGTLVLLSTSPVKDWEVVFGKFLAAMVFIGLLTVLSAYMPALIFINGKVSMGHIFGGYLGVLLLGAACIALGLLASAIAPNQLIAVILGAVLVLTFWLFWLLSQVASPPVEGLLEYLSLHHKHFRPFMRGIVSTQDVLFYVSLSFVSLLIATRVLEARRWR